MNDTLENSNCGIIIPIYKTELTKYEIASLKQCCKILRKHALIFVTHKYLNCSIYNNICSDFNIIMKYEYFHKKYFNDISGYNALLLSKCFYKRFIDYSYILIYQLDAYVFKDELEYWCKKGYDYIGAPWLKLNKLEPSVYFQDSPNVGNGGFSLRKTKIFIEKLNPKLCFLISLFIPYYNNISLKYSRNIFTIFLRFLLSFFLKLIRFILIKYRYLDNNEDNIWAYLLYKDGNIPSPHEASRFSFEEFPDYLYKMNNNELPFGCHSWFTYQNFIFYRNHICL